MRLSTLALLQHMLAALHAALADVDAAAAAADECAAADAAAAAARRSGLGLELARGGTSEQHASAAHAGGGDGSDIGAVSGPQFSCCEAQVQRSPGANIMEEDGGAGNAPAAVSDAGDGSADLARADYVNMDEAAEPGRAVDGEGLASRAAGGVGPAGGMEGGGAGWRALAAQLRSAARARLPDPQARSRRPDCCAKICPLSHRVARVRRGCTACARLRSLQEHKALNQSWVAS